MSKRNIVGFSPEGEMIALQVTPDGYLKVSPQGGVANAVSAFGIRQDSDGPAAANGQPHPLIINPDGRLKTAGAPAQYAPITGTITANAQTIFMDTTSVSNLVCHVTGTFASVNVSFEASLNSTNGTDGNWFGIQAVRTNSNVIESATGLLSATPIYGWELSVNAFKWIRIRSTAWTSGTQSWVFTLGSYATEPIPAIQTHAVTQSGAFTFTPLTPTSHNLNSAATTNATSVKNTVGTIFGLNAFNYTAATIYLKLYNKASAPTVGTDVPVMVVPLAADSRTTLDTGTLGMRLATGIAYCLVTGEPDTDTTAITAGAVKVKMDYV